MTVLPGSLACGHSGAVWTLVAGTIMADLANTDLRERSREITACIDKGGFAA